MSRSWLRTAAGRLARGPARVDIRAFDPDEVARLEAAMWRSYYDRRRLPLFRQLVALLRGQFRLAPARSLATAFLAARAARLELDWWIVHREADGHPPGDLEAALAALAAELYQVPAGRLADHAAGPPPQRRKPLPAAVAGVTVVP